MLDPAPRKPQPLWATEATVRRPRIAIAPAPKRRVTMNALNVFLIFVVPAALFAGLVCWSLRKR